MPHRGDNFERNGYVPLQGDVVHLNWSPAAGQEMIGPHYGLVVLADLFNQGCSLAVVVPITSKGGKLSGFELAVEAGRLRGVAVLSGLRAMDYQARDLQFDTHASDALIAEANRPIRMIFP